MARVVLVKMNQFHKTPKSSASYDPSILLLRYKMLRDGSLYFMLRDGWNRSHLSTSGRSQTSHEIYQKYFRSASNKIESNKMVSSSFLLKLKGVGKRILVKCLKLNWKKRNNFVLEDEMILVKFVSLVWTGWPRIFLIYFVRCLAPTRC